MGSIHVKELEIGSVAPLHLRDHKGAVLVNEGVKITWEIKSALIRRNISEVFYQDEGEEVKKILATKFSAVDELEIEQDILNADQDTEPEAPPAVATTEVERPAQALLNSLELKQIKKGQEGYRQILQSAKVKDFERKIENPAGLPGKPMGSPLSDEVTQKAPEVRTIQYKDSICDSYEKALLLTSTTLNNLRDGQKVDGGPIRKLAEDLVRIFVTDKNILLNISGTKSATDDHLYNHSLNVALLAINIAAAAGYSKQQVVEIGMAALLHDIGMTLVPENVRLKKGRLTKDEHFEIRKHPILGLHLIEKLNGVPESAAYVAYQTHERENGDGYPKGRKGRFLHTYARVVMIADVFEALSSPRPYRPPRIPYDSMRYVLAFVRRGLFEPVLSRCFIKYAALFPVGSMVRLNTQEIAKVVEANGKHYTKPVVGVIADREGKVVPDSQIRHVDLSTKNDAQIIQALANDVLRINQMKGF